MRYRFLCVTGLLAAFVVCLGGCASAQRDWKQASEEGTIPAYERFVAEYPESEFTFQANAKLAELRADRAWNTATEANDIAAYEGFLSDHGRARQAGEARNRLAKLQLERDWKTTEVAGGISAYESFLEKHPRSEHTEAAQARLGDLRADREWARIKDGANIPAYEAFLVQYGESAHAAAASARLEELRIAAAFADACGVNTAEAYEAFIEKHGRSKYAPDAQKRYDDLTRPALITAARDDNLAQVRARIDAGDDVAVRWRGTTPLMYAAHNGNVEMTRLLIDKGADIQAHSLRESALLLADYGNYVGKQTPAQAEIAEMLVKAALKDLDKAPSARQIRGYVVSALKASKIWQGSGGAQLFAVTVEDATKGTIRVRCNAATWGDVAMYEVATIGNSVMPEPPDKTIYTHVAFGGADALEFVIAPTGAEPAWSIEAVRR
jgi:ankyrin repeat protein